MMLVNNIFSQNSFKIVCLFGVMETETSTDVFICVLMFSCPISLSSVIAFIFVGSPVSISILENP